MSAIRNCYMRCPVFTYPVSMAHQIRHGKWLIIRPFFLWFSIYTLKVVLKPWPKGEKKKEKVKFHSSIWRILVKLLKFSTFRESQSHRLLDLRNTRSQWQLDFIVFSYINFKMRKLHLRTVIWFGKNFLVNNSQAFYPVVFYLGQVFLIY